MDFVKTALEKCLGMDKRINLNIPRMKLEIIGKPSVGGQIDTNGYVNAIC